MITQSDPLIFKEPRVMVSIEGKSMLWYVMKPLLLFNLLKRQEKRLELHCT